MASLRRHDGVGQRTSMLSAARISFYRHDRPAVNETVATVSRPATVCRPPAERSVVIMV
jgi:hypothetical protein